jgi:HEAT repeat protein
MPDFVKKLLPVFLLAAALLAGCSSTPYGDHEEDDKRNYIEDDTLEAFDNDLRMLSLAISRAEDDQERALRTKISESARLYQKALISALHDYDSTPRRALAAVMLGFTGDASVVSPLLEKVNDTDEPEHVRLNAVLGLATLDDKLRDYEQHGVMMKTLGSQLKSKEASFGMRRAAVMAYAVAFDGAQNDSILPLRDAFLSDPELDVQIAAINAMGDIGDTAAVPDLVVVGLDHPNPEIRSASAVALGKIADPARVIPALESACLDDSAVVRRQSVDAISKHYGSDPERVFAVLITGLSDFDPRVRESAALALARIQDPRAIDSLLQATGDRVATVRAAAALSLGQLIPNDREKESFPLVELLADQNPGVQAAALSSLAVITKEDFGGEQPRWQQYFYKKYPDLDPANMYAGGPKPRVSSGISNSGSRRVNTSSQPRNNNNSSRNNRNNSSNRNNTRTNNSSRTNNNTGR